MHYTCITYVCSVAYVITFRVIVCIHLIRRGVDQLRCDVVTCSMSVFVRTNFIRYLMYFACCDCF